MQGRNAQGKTNLLEAIYLMATLRSFRGVGGSQMVRDGSRGYFVGGRVIGAGTSEIRIFWSPRERRLKVNGNSVRRMNDYFGTVRSVVFCTEDLQLIKGTGRIRRRFLDLLLAQTHGNYLSTLQRYARLVRSRNALLKQKYLDSGELEGFTRQLVQEGNRLMEWRRRLVPLFSPLAQAAFGRIGGESESLHMEYHPSVKGDFAVELARQRERERQYGMTFLGPHRDEVRLLINDKAADTHASEGQKRSLAIALKMAQAEYLTRLHGAPPILLIDDVMGELDASRRAAMMPMLERTRSGSGQVFLTCTEANWPRTPDSAWFDWTVDHGTVTRDRR